MSPVSIPSKGMVNSFSKWRKSFSSAYADFKDTTLILALIYVLVVANVFGVFYVVDNLTRQDTYYVLNTNMPSKTQVTASDLTPRITRPDSTPPNAISLDEVNQGTVFTKYPLQAGDVLSSSNVGSLDKD